MLGVDATLLKKIYVKGRIKIFHVKEFWVATISEQLNAFFLWKQYFFLNVHVIYNLFFSSDITFISPSNTFTRVMKQLYHQCKAYNAHFILGVKMLQLLIIKIIMSCQKQKCIKRRKLVKCWVVVNSRINDLSFRRWWWSSQV